MADGDERGAVIAALMTLAGERPWDEVTLTRIAERAGLPLAAVRGRFSGRAAILEAFVAEIDAAVIAGADPDMADEPARDRLFDVVMRRLDCLAPYKAGLKGLRAAAVRDPALALWLARLGLSSQRWMLETAGIPATTPFGRLRAGGLALVEAEVLKVWLDEDDPVMPRTMAALDRALGRGEKALARACRLRDRLAPLLKPVMDRCAGAAAGRPPAAEAAGPDPAN
ncbi:TetR/AcrR family transcriptional regulator [Pseudoxanthobacter sp.]|uniref:TetR/AcrR family transcriptional regulator n=1 Tax=Pseudoxanthobacter sp. TaxID=1925742 RepID=UPI002FE33B5F